jgi:hypothetical protein
MVAFLRRNILTHELLLTIICGRFLKQNSVPELAKPSLS